MLDARGAVSVTARYDGIVPDPGFARILAGGSGLSRDHSHGTVGAISCRGIIVIRFRAHSSVG